MFYGDGLLCPPEGYGEGIVELLVLRHPDAAFRSFHHGEESLALDAALRGAASLIGKAPDFVFLGLGNVDMLRGVAPAEALASLRALIQVVLLKTQARVAVANVCGAFLPPEARAGAAGYNAGLMGLPGESGDRVRVVNIDDPVNAFLEAHRRGGGEKRSLHVRPLCPTSMGRVFLSNTVFGLLSLEDIFTV